MASKNTEELIKNLLYLIQDNEYRFKLSKKIAKKNTDLLLISKEISNKSDVVDTFKWLWKNHHKQLEHGSKKISYKTINSD